jgi:hypothetical protein
MAPSISLNCTIVDANVRVLHAAFAFLARISSEISLEVRDGNALMLRALNDAKSSFASVSFAKEFFFDFQTQPRAAPAANAGAGAGPTAALFSSRALANVLRSLRDVKSVQLYFAEVDSSHHFVAVLRQRNGVTRTHSVYYADTEVVDAVFDRNMAQNVLIGPPELLDRVVGRICGTEEVSLLALGNVAQLQGFHESGVESTVRGAVHTAVSLELSSFDKAVIAVPQSAPAVPSQPGAGGGTQPAQAPVLGGAVPTNITFSMRELKHLLSFAQAAGVSSEEVALLFNSPSQPMFASTRGVVRRSFHADLVVATLEQQVLPAEGSQLALYIKNSAQ